MLSSLLPVLLGKRSSYWISTTPYPQSYIPNYCSTSPMLRSLTAERDKRRINNPCVPYHAAAGPTHLATPMQRCTGPNNKSFRLQWPFPKTHVATCSSSAKWWASGSIPPPNNSIAFQGKSHFSQKAIAKAFNRQLNTVPLFNKIGPFWRLLLDIYSCNNKDPDYRSFN